MLARWDRALWELRQIWDADTLGEFPVPESDDSRSWGRRHQAYAGEAENSDADGESISADAQTDSPDADSAEIDVDQQDGKTRTSRMMIQKTWVTQNPVTMMATIAMKMRLPMMTLRSGRRLRRYRSLSNEEDDDSSEEVVTEDSPDSGLRPTIKNTGRSSSAIPS